eukprot:1109710-Pyramimonas_sp.AAC.1
MHRPVAECRRSSRPTAGLCTPQACAQPMHRPVTGLGTRYAQACRGVSALAKAQHWPVHMPLVGLCTGCAQACREALALPEAHHRPAHRNLSQA